MDDLTIDPNAVDSNKYKQIFGIREVHFLSVFALIYVGTEVTIGSTSRLSPLLRARVLTMRQVGVSRTCRRSGTARRIRDTSRPASSADLCSVASC